MHLALVKSLIATLVLLWLYPDGTFFITADSAEEKLLNGVRTVDNDMCKLFPTGNVVFFETGHPIVFFNGMTVVNGEWIAKRLLTGESRLKTKEDVDRAADQWAKEMKIGFDYYISKYPTVQPYPEDRTVFSSHR
jgi:hypothetical protein